MLATALADEIRAYLAQRRDALSREIHDYPTPIARCDAQLGGLLEERTAIAGVLDSGDDRALIEAFVAASATWADAEAQRLRAAAR